MSELQAIQDICKKYVEEDCEGCPFDSYAGFSNYGLECDSGIYSKDRWKIDEIREIIAKENEE